MGWLALLRAVNLGPRNKVPMAALREAFEGAGCEDVLTYIQSGNVVFRAATTNRGDLRSRLEAVVERSFGVTTTVVLRTWDEVARVASSHPFGADTSKSAVTFLAEKPTLSAVRRLRRLDVAPDQVKVVGRDVLLHYPHGLQGARLTGAVLERELGVIGTNRNWRTVAKLAELAADAR